MFFANRLEPCLALDDSQVARGPGFIGLHAVSEPDTFDDFGNLVSFYPVVKGCQSNSGMSPSVFPTPACRVDLHTASTPNGHNASRTLARIWRQPSAAAAESLAVAGRAPMHPCTLSPSSRFDVVSAMPSSLFLQSVRPATAALRRPRDEGWRHIRARGVGTGIYRASHQLRRR